MAANKGSSVGVLAVPTVGLDSRSFAAAAAADDDDDDSAGIALSRESERYASGDLETLASIQADLECMNAEEVVSTEEEQPIVREEADGALSDVEMKDVSEEARSDPIIYANRNQAARNVIFQTKPILQRVPITAVQVKPNVATQPAQSQSIMIVSPAGGQGASQILKISHPASASAGQLQSLAQTLITAKSADGNIVQLRSAHSGKPLVSSGQTGNITIGSLQTVKSVQSVKRPAQTAQQSRNVYTKMILSGGNQAQTSGQVLVATSQGESPQAPTVKFLSAASGNEATSSPTKTITLAQAQQMGLIASKAQHILPSSPQKQQGIIVNKLIQSTSSQPPKLTLIPTSGARSPTKILPAPSQVTSQMRPVNSQAHSTSGKTTTIQQSPQKVIIRQSALKPGTVLGSGQVIRIPANQNIVTGSNQVHQIQMPGRQVQYVRLVSTSSSGTSNVVTVGKPKPPQGTLQTVGMTQKMVAGGQQQIVKVVPLNTGNQPLRSVAPKSSITTGSQRLLIPASGSLSHTKSTVAIPASALSQLASGQAVISTSTNVGNIVVLPAQYIQQQGGIDEPKGKSPSTPSLLSTSQSSQSSSGNISTNSTLLENKSSQRSYPAVEPNGIRPRKPCNCTKSQCLKLYCDCFANGEFCHMCNCNNCSNNLGNEEERQRAIRSCLERNPNAFRPKIGKGRDTGDDIRRHNKGCNCKRSGCLKNYCECYEAKIPCSANCKCIGCRNVEEPALEKKSLKDLAEAVEVRTAQLSLNKAKIQQLSEMAFRPQASSNTGARQTFNFLTDKVVEITCQCLLAQAEEAERNMLDEDTSQRLIIEEFGRCLKEIIESAHKAEAT